MCSAGCETAFVADPLAHPSVARDPVCGMDVAVTPDATRAAHGGISYVFCGAGCQTAFRADPYAFLEAGYGATRAH